MKTTIPKLRKMIRKVIVESMSPSDPDYETVAEVIMQATRTLMRSGGMTGDEVLQMCEELAGDYQVYHHLDYIFDKVNANKLRMGF